MRTRTATISAVLADRGVKVRYGGSHSRFTEDQVREMARCYESGESLRSLAQRFGAGKVTTVRNALLRVGVQTRQARRPVFWTPEREQEVADAYRAGESQQAIADRLGISQPSVAVHLRSAGVVTRGPRFKGSNHPAWKGGRMVTDQGYVLVKPAELDLPYCTLNSTGYAVEHRLVVGRALGRKLTRSESVHHVNGDKTDNRLENLQVRQGQHGVGIVFQCLACGSHNVRAVPLEE
jgi:DNA-binding CsgD family transcriptional regulator